MQQCRLEIAVKTPDNSDASPLTYNGENYYKIHKIDIVTQINPTDVSANDSISAFTTALNSASKDVKYTIYLRPNSSILKGIAFRYDSITAPDVTVDYNVDSTDYKEFLLPSDIKRLFVYAEPVDPAVRPVIKNTRK